MDFPELFGSGIIETRFEVDIRIREEIAAKKFACTHSGKRYVSAECRQFA